MGFYIESGQSTGKADYLIEHWGGREIPRPPKSFDQIPLGMALIVVIQNRSFDAAGFAYDEEEFKVFTSPDDRRPKRYILIDRTIAEGLSGYDK